jgi:hypothetical protein
MRWSQRFALLRHSSTLENAMTLDRTRGAAAPSALPVRLLRLADGQERLALALSREILGFAGHWDGETFQSCRQRQGRCKWCPGPTAWRGYFAALVWDGDAQAWQPFGVEVSETVEATMREQYRAGTRWHLCKPWPLRVGGKPRKQRLVATLRGAHEHAELPPPFDFTPLLRSLYQDPDLMLDMPNPKPIVTTAAYVQPAAPEAAKRDTAPGIVRPLPTFGELDRERFGSEAQPNGKK